MNAEGEESRNWGNMRFRPRSAAANRSSDEHADTRFVTGAVLFVLVALAYPWYSYWVNSHLLARDMRAAVVELDRQTLQFGSGLSAQIQPHPSLHGSAPARAATPAVRVMGVSEGTSGIVLLAELGDSSLGDARESLCFQAGRWIRRSADGTTFRVQRYRGDAPALHAGSIRC